MSGDAEADVEVLSSRVLLRPADLERTRVFYRDVLGLAIFREFATPGGTGTVFFAGGGFIEVSGGATVAATPAGVELWLQVRDVHLAHRELAAKGVTILREPRREPWGLIEMWISDPDGVRLCLVEVPDDHPLRWRPSS